MTTQSSLEDEYYLPEVGQWAERKHRLVSLYAEMFSTSMRNKWDHRVYVDLFTGAGCARIKGTQRTVLTSPLLAMSVPHPFTKYVLCDIDERCIEAVRARSAKRFPDLSVRCIQGDSNENAEAVLAEIRSSGKGSGLLAFCVVDPFRIANLSFETIRKLSVIRADFLVLIPSHMDANRQRVYEDPSNTRIADFTGSVDWRERYSGSVGDFGTFVVSEFGRSMEQLGFKNPQGNEVLITVPGTSQKLYYLAFYSRSDLANKFWREAQKYSHEQLDLF